MRILFLFMALTTFSYGNLVAQEVNCADGLDNDGDGLYDCADTDCSGEPICANTFQCVEGLYQRVGTDFSVLDVSTASYIPYFTHSDLTNVQGGYNVRDGYMYGMKSSNSGGDTWLRKVSKTSTSTVCTVTGTPAGFQGTSADMDFDNYLYLIQTNATPSFFSRVNVTDCTRLTKDFANVATPATPAVLPSTVADIAYIDNESTVTKKVFYGLSKGLKLYRIIFDDALTRATWEEIADYSGTYTPTTDGFGAMWYDNTNNELLTSWNNTGNIYKIDLVSPSTMTFSFSGASTSNNDGFSCSLAPAPAILLPVELISFTTDVKGCNVQLNWATATEQNASHFEVQQSTTGKEWNTIGEIIATGNSLSEKNYEFSATLKTQQTTYFRLKMVDLDASFAYTPTRTAICGKEEKNMFIVYPNPFKDLLQINDLIKKSLVRILRLDGSIYLEYIVESDKVELDLSSLPSGIYILQVQADGQESYFRKITKSNN